MRGGGGEGEVNTFLGKEQMRCVHMYMYNVHVYIIHIR